MSFQMRVKDSGVLIVGTMERIIGVASVSGFDSFGTPEYTGHTEVDWDSQEQMRAGGALIYVGDDGREYLAHFCELVEDPQE